MPPIAIPDMFMGTTVHSIYTYKGQETPGAIPRIIDDDLFERAQARLAKSKKAPAQAKAKAEYLLTTKLFCGHCREMMTGYAGTSKTGSVHHYYICNGRKKKTCNKKNVRKEYIEDLVISKCRSLLTDENIRLIAKEVAAVCAADYDGSLLKSLRVKLKEVEKAIDNLLTALESGQAADVITTRISQRTDDRLMYSIPALPGSSGSPVVNLRGQLVAINYAGINTTQSFNYGIRVKHLRNLIMK